MNQSTNPGYPTIEIGKKPTNFITRFLKKTGIFPLYKKYAITPVLVNVRKKVSEIIVTLPNEIFTDGMEKSASNLYVEHIDELVEIIGLGMTNNNTGPSKRLLKQIKNEFTVNDLHQAMQIITAQMNVHGFIRCLEFIGSHNVLSAPSEQIEMRLPAGINPPEDNIDENKPFKY